MGNDSRARRRRDQLTIATGADAQRAAVPAKRSEAIACTCYETYGDCMREKIWLFAVNKVPEGEILPWWALIIRAALYPLDFFYWQMSKSRGYQPYRDTWIIHGVKFSGRALLSLADAQGATYRISRSGETVTLERVS